MWIIGKMSFKKIIEIVLASTELFQKWLKHCYVVEQHKRKHKNKAGLQKKFKDYNTEKSQVTCYISYDKYKNINV